jgi:hypothetical protein
MAPAQAPGPSSFRPAAKAIAHKGRPRPAVTSESLYLERALLLWPRLDRAKLRRIADDPCRIAEMVVRRTSQPYEVILAMLLRQNPCLGAPTEEPGSFEMRPGASRVALHIVRSEDGGEIRVQTLLPL